MGGREPNTSAILILCSLCSTTDANRPEKKYQVLKTYVYCMADLFMKWNTWSSYQLTNYTLTLCIRQLWLDSPKTATYAHNGKECFSLSIDSSINKLTNYHNTTANSWLVCFFWGLFQRPVRRPRVLGCPLNTIGWLIQAATLLKITAWLVHDVDHGGLILDHFTLKIAEHCFNPPLCDYRPPPPITPI